MGEIQSDLNVIQLRLENLETSINEQKESIKEFKKTNSESHAKIFSRLEQTEQAIKVNNVQYEHIINSLENINTEIQITKNKINEVKQKPADRWEKVVMIIITAIVGGVVGFAINALFK